jgi:hypothetical protein
MARGVGVLAAKAARHGGPKAKKRILSIICTLTLFSLDDRSSLIASMLPLDQDHRD